MDNATEAKLTLTVEELTTIVSNINCLDKQLKIIVKLFNDLAEKIVSSKDLNDKDEQD